MHFKVEDARKTLFHAWRGPMFFFFFLGRKKVVLYDGGCHSEAKPLSMSRTLHKILVFIDCDPKGQLLKSDVP